MTSAEETTTPQRRIVVGVRTNHCLPYRPHTAHEGYRGSAKRSALGGTHRTQSADSCASGVLPRPLRKSGSRPELTFPSSRGGRSYRHA